MFLCLFFFCVAVVAVVKLTLCCNGYIDIHLFSIILPSLSLGFLFLFFLLVLLHFDKME